MTTKALTTVKYRGSITRLLQSLSTLRGLGRPSTPQDSLLADDQSLPGRIVYLQDHDERFQFYSSPFPRLTWRDATPDESISNDAKKQRERGVDCVALRLRRWIHDDDSWTCSFRAVSPTGASIVMLSCPMLGAGNDRNCLATGADDSA